MSEAHEIREFLILIQRLEKIMADVPAGLASLQEEIAKLEATGAALLAYIQTLSQPNTEDAAVAAAATQLDELNTTLSAAIPAPAVPAAPPAA